MTESPIQRERWPDLVRVVAALSVVILHSLPDIYRMELIPLPQWQFANIIHSFGRSAVPLFFMLTGYLLLRRPESKRVFQGKRLRRILVPWLVWSLIYLAYDGRLQGPDVIRRTVHALFNAECCYHLWFFYALAPGYLVLPAVAWCLENDFQKRSWFLVTVWLLFCLNQQWKALGMTPALNFPLPAAFQFVGFMVLGALLGDTQFPRIPRARLWILFVAGVALTAWPTNTISSRAGHFVGHFHSFLSLNVILMAASAFLLLKSFDTDVELRRLSRASFGIYLIHPLVLKVGERVFPGLYDFVPYPLPILGFFVFLVSFLVVEQTRYLLAMDWWRFPIKRANRWEY